MMDGELHVVEKVSGSAKTFDKIGDAVAKIIEKEARENELLLRYADAIDEVTERIKDLEPIQFQILHQRYVQLLKPADVAALHDRSPSWVSTNQNRALAALEKLLA